MDQCDWGVYCKSYQANITNKHISSCLNCRFSNSAKLSLLPEGDADWLLSYYLIPLCSTIHIGKLRILRGDSALLSAQCDMQWQVSRYNVNMTGWIVNHAYDQRCTVWTGVVCVWITLSKQRQCCMLHYMYISKYTIC